MKASFKKLLLIFSIAAVICPAVAAAITAALEPELGEALLAGLLFGCAVGSVLGIVSLFLNKGRSRAVTVMSCIPLCPLAVYLVLFIPYLLFK